MIPPDHILFALVSGMLEIFALVCAMLYVREENNVALIFALIAGGVALICWRLAW